MILYNMLRKWNARILHIEIVFIFPEGAFSLNVRKRDGKIVCFDREYIARAVTLAAAAAGEHDEELAQRISIKVEAALTQKEASAIDIEAIQDMVEQVLFEEQRFRTAKAYIRYRMEK